MVHMPQTFPSNAGPHKLPTDRQHSRRDRIMAVVVLVIIAALMGLMIWLAQLGGGAPENFNNYWPMM